LNVQIISIAQPVIILIINHTLNNLIKLELFLKLKLSAMTHFFMYIYHVFLLYWLIVISEQVIYNQIAVIVVLHA